MSSHEEAATFKVNVRLVLVRVVVRDAKGQPVTNLRKEDFQLFDSRKPQVITQFSVEHPGSQVAREVQTTESPAGENLPANIPNVPERFVAYVFDDLHLHTSDLLPVRAATERHLNTLLRKDRAGIFTTSAHTSVDFTDDREKLGAGLLRLAPSSLGTENDCPSISYYMADMMVNKSDQQALGIVAPQVLQCFPHLDPRETAQMALSAAQRALTRGDAETHRALASLEDLLRRMAAMPGQRTVVLVSPGFITPYLEQEVSDVIDGALRDNVIVSTLDARGLYVPGPFRDISKRDAVLVTSPQAEFYEEGEDSADADVLAILADSTGGIFFHNSNDFEPGLKQAGETSAFYYLLGFSPRMLKYDGSFHGITVKLVNQPGLKLQARKGYYAPKKAPKADEEGEEQIEDALFSQEEMHDLPVELRTQFFKASDVDAKLSVLIHVDVKRLHYQKVEGRNNNALTIATALFDHDGRLSAETRRF
jgi:VWFA-related protein